MFATECPNLPDVRSYLSLPYLSAFNSNWELQRFGLIWFGNSNTSTDHVSGNNKKADNLLKHTVLVQL